MDWPYVTRYKGVVSAQKHREEIIQDLFIEREDPVKGVVHSGIIRYRWLVLLMQLLWSKPY